MSTTAELISGGARAVGAGKAIDSNSIESVVDETSTTMSPASPESDEMARSENSTADDLLPGSEDTPVDSQDGKGPASPKAARNETPTKEVITVTDADGRRRKVEIDYTNREATKKAHLMAAGARKWQAERDQALSTHKEAQSKLEERNRDWATLEKAFQQGPDALFDMLQGRRGAFQEHVQKQLARAEYLKNASPEEVQALEAKERGDRQARELDQIRKENEEFRKQVSQERETAELRSLESRVNPTFDKYRFADKLDNADDEHMFDEMLWNSALKRLEPYEERGVDLTPEIIDREFRTVAGAIRRRIGTQANKAVSKVIDQKKQEATENVQAKVLSGYKTGGAAQEARGLLQSGNLTGLLKNWNKYGNLFQGGKK